MRTTVDIPDELLRRAKSEAALRGMRLKDVVRQALQRFLSDTDHEDAAQLPPGLGALVIGEGCVFPLITAGPGPAMKGLGRRSAQRLLDEEDLDRADDPR